ncbi:MAG: hypothetical protein JWR89_5210 [Tardiphaga sp.]|uniref:hypothetical protein n=1 Tax=Tardiphaga sp. TaxID=1926292 RepID=UPI002627BF2F|nr:hypothetical protein [Tardiphaga sp.]MDB5505308.1 hypothetical protein [Tardiphaga sp.]
MAKRTVSADDLVFLIEQELRGKDGKTVPALSVAIVPDPAKDWIVVTSPKDLRRHPELVKRVGRIETKLKALYRLKPD